MRLGRYASAVRKGLRFHAQAWCLCVEASVPQEMHKGEIERQLFSTDSEGRQWYRWKNQLIPNPKEFNAANAAALAADWIPKEISDALSNSFAIHSSNQSEVHTRSGWDQMIAVSACEKFAKERNDSILCQLCFDWREWIEGPAESDPRFNTWLAERAPGWEVEDEEILKLEVERVVQFAAAQIVELGIDDPIKAINETLAELKKNELWSECLQILIAEREGHE